MKIRPLLLLLLVLHAFFIHAQKDSTKVVTLKPVEVISTRINTASLKSPMAISVRQVGQTQQNRQQLSLQEYLNTIPGLYSTNGNNFAQDIRISLRGFGARSAFGIRGIKILVDGIPETTPDGQGQVDNLDLGIIRKIEVIKGPMATLYGNASGGVLSFYTRFPEGNDALELATTTGSYGMFRAQFNAATSIGKSAILISGNHTKSDGYRNQSHFKSSSLNASLQHKLSRHSTFNLRLNYTDSPYAWDAGGLTAQEVKENRRQARQRNIDFKTNEAIRHFKTGAHYTYKKEDFHLKSYAFYASRSFYGLLPFEFGGVVDLNRNYYGGGVSAEFIKQTDKVENKLQIGIDIANQEDQRDRFYNLSGTAGDQTMGQLESFNAFGLYILDHLSIGGFTIQGGLRFDSNKLKADDQLLDNGDQSGKRNYEEISPNLGLSLAINDKSRIFTAFSTSFETPVLSELSANPSGNEGFNDDLQSQESESIEFGYKMKSNTNELYLTVFNIVTTNAMIPYELENFPGRTFYQNAGKTKRMGFELYFRHKISQQLAFSTGYTYSDFEFKEYQVDGSNFNGNTLPGIPKNMGHFSLDFNNWNDFMSTLEVQYLDEKFADNANTVTDSSVVLVNLRISKTLTINKITLIPFLGINNLLNRNYNDNIRINAFGRRYFEPGPGFHMFGGLRFHI